MNAAIPPDLPQPGQNGASQPGEPVEGEDFRYWFYCMEEDHPGSPKFSQEPMDLGRIFGTNSGEGCPICPKCQRQVSAQQAYSPDIPPPAIAEYARRFAATMRRFPGR